MTPQEQRVISWLEHRGGTATTTEAARQFGLSAGYIDLIVRGLKRNLWIEQDRHYIRNTTVGEAALAQAINGVRPEPFAGRKQW